MFDDPTNYFHGHFNYLEIEIFDFGNFSKFREKTPGKWFPGKKFSRELPGNHFLGQNYHMNPIGHLFSICDVTPVIDFLVDALLIVTDVYCFDSELFQATRSLPVHQ